MLSFVCSLFSKVIDLSIEKTLIISALLFVLSKVVIALDAFEKSSKQQSAHLSDFVIPSFTLALCVVRFIFVIWLRIPPTAVSVAAMIGSIRLLISELIARFSGLTGRI